MGSDLDEAGVDRVPDLERQITDLTEQVDRLEGRNAQLQQLTLEADQERAVAEQRVADLDLKLDAITSALARTYIQLEESEASKARLEAEAAHIQKILEEHEDKRKQNTPRGMSAPAGRGMSAPRGGVLKSP